MKTNTLAIILFSAFALLSSMSCSKSSDLVKAEASRHEAAVKAIKDAKAKELALEEGNHKIALATVQVEDLKAKVESEVKTLDKKEEPKTEVKMETKVAAPVPAPTPAPVAITPPTSKVASQVAINPVTQE